MKIKISVDFPYINITAKYENQKGRFMKGIT